MRFLRHLALPLLLVAAGAWAQGPSPGTDGVAREAVDTALALPPGPKRDTVLRAVSRNLRWFGQPEQGVRAARGMTDGGADEVPPGTRPGPPRFIPLDEAFPSGSPCDAGLWRKEGGGTARSPKARERWATECLLDFRRFHHRSLPDVALVRQAAAALPAGEAKAGVLAMLIGSYRDTDALRFAAAEFDRDGARFPADAHAGLRAMLAEPAVLLRLGRKPEALVAAGTARTLQQKAELIRLLLRDDDAAGALAVFETLRSTPPEFSDGYDGWFGGLGGLDLTHLGHTRDPVPALGPFIDGLARSALFRRVCPTGLPAETVVPLLLTAGRLDAAVARARDERERPFLLVGTSVAAGEVLLLQGRRDAARALARKAAAALPPFDPGDPVPPPRTGGDTMTSMSDEAAGPARHPGEGPANTRLRFEVIRLLAATGATADADALARAQPAGALRAVALSAAAAGRPGIRYGDQEPSLEVIGSDDL